MKLIVAAISFLLTVCWVQVAAAAPITLCLCIPHDQSVNSDGIHAGSGDYFEGGLSFVATDMIAALQPTLSPFGIQNISPIGVFYVMPNVGVSTWKLESITFSGNPTGMGHSLLSARAMDGSTIVERELDDSAQTIDFSNDPLWANIRLLVWCANSIPCANGSDYTDSNVMTSLTYSVREVPPSPPPSNIPEPLTLVLFGSGLAGIVKLRKRNMLQ